MPLVANEYFVVCMYVREKLEGMSRKCCACFLFGMNDSSSFFLSRRSSGSIVTGHLKGFTLQGFIVH